MFVVTIVVVPVHDYYSNVLKWGNLVPQNPVILPFISVSSQGILSIYTSMSMVDAKICKMYLSNSSADIALQSHLHHKLPYKLTTAYNLEPMI